MASSNELPIDSVIYELIETFSNSSPNEHHFQNDLVISILNSASSIFQKEPIIFNIDSNCVVVGDLHGNFDDLIRIFQHYGYPPSTRYLFLGDYVDRGKNGFEVFLLLSCMKIKFPKNIFLLRGNHECRSLTTNYGFLQEVLSKKYPKSVYDGFIDTFIQLPFCAVINDKILCLHGGISPTWHNLNDILTLSKPNEFFTQGILTDIVWSDPDFIEEDFGPNFRGTGTVFNSRALKKFLDNNSLSLLIRSHEQCNNGFCWTYSSDNEMKSRCLTIFSTSDYCSIEINAAVAFITSDLQVQIQHFPFLTDEQKSRFVIKYPDWLLYYVNSPQRDSFNLSDEINMSLGSDSSLFDIIGTDFSFN